MSSTWDPPDFVLRGYASLADVVCNRCFVTYLLLKSHLAEEIVMFKYAIIFALISVVAGVFGFTGVAAGAAGIAKIAFGLFLILTIIFIVLAALGVGAVKKVMK